MNERHHDLEDGSTEVVDHRPARTSPPVASLEEAVESPVSGRLEAARAKINRNDYIALRTPLGAAQIALSHLTIFGALWRLWAGKTALKEDGGVTAAEVAEAAQKPENSVRAVLKTLIHNRVVRTLSTHVGEAHIRTSYFPTEFGVQAYALAEMLGPGSSVTVGRTQSVWVSRSADEPSNFFKHAAFLSGKP